MARSHENRRKNDLSRPEISSLCRSGSVTRSDLSHKSSLSPSLNHCSSLSHDICVRVIEEKGRKERKERRRREDEGEKGCRACCVEQGVCRAVQNRGGARAAVRDSEGGREKKRERKKEEEKGSGEEKRKRRKGSKRREREGGGITGWGRKRKGKEWIRWPCVTL